MWPPVTSHSGYAVMSGSTLKPCKGMKPGRLGAIWMIPGVSEKASFEGKGCIFDSHGAQRSPFRQHPGWWQWWPTSVVIPMAVAPPLFTVTWGAQWWQLARTAWEEREAGAAAVPEKWGWTCSLECAWIWFASLSTRPRALCELTESKKLPAESILSGFFPDPILVSPVGLWHITGLWIRRKVRVHPTCSTKNVRPFGKTPWPNKMTQDFPQVFGDVATGRDVG